LASAPGRYPAAPEAEGIALPGVGTPDVGVMLKHLSNSCEEMLTP